MFFFVTNKQEYRFELLNDGNMDEKAFIREQNSNGQIIDCIINEH